MVITEISAAWSSKKQTPHGFTESNADKLSQPGSQLSCSTNELLRHFTTGMHQCEENGI